MYPRTHAQSRPNDRAIVMAGSGLTVTFGELEARANQGAHLFRELGLKAGDTIAILLENRPEYLEVYWAAQRAGLYITPVSTRLTPPEAAYIISDSGAQVLITSNTAGDGVAGLMADRATLIPGVRAVFAVGEGLAGAEGWEAARSVKPETPIADETAGYHMVYSSGTTGRPKGIRLPLAGGPAEAPLSIATNIGGNYGVDESTVYLSPAPMYHTAPLMYSTSVQRFGGTVVIMEHFDAEAFLQAVEKYRVTFTQVVPTMFVRLLKLPKAVREKYDVSSLKRVVHAAAPCPVPVKQQMIEWLGPIIYEYYGGSEANGSTFITPEEWLRKPGSVGRAGWGVIHIVGEDGEELPPGEIGTVYFSGGLDFKYHNDPEKTASARHAVHKTWSTMGDIGYVDEDGYLFLTDRKAFMIISGGVNIYPQEAENVLIGHPKVADAAVFGVPNADFGEEVKAVVQPLDWADAGPELARELMSYCRTNLSAIKCPRSIDFDKELPRHPTGKLYKQQVKARYWPAPSA